MISRNTSEAATSAQEAGSQERACTLLRAVNFNIVLCLSFLSQRVPFLCSYEQFFGICDMNCFIFLRVPDIKVTGNRKKKSKRRLKFA
jgi:hypothetical protein